MTGNQYFDELNEATDELGEAARTAKECALSLMGNGSAPETAEKLIDLAMDLSMQYATHTAFLDDELKHGGQEWVSLDGIRVSKRAQDSETAQG